MPITTTKLTAAAGLAAVAAGTLFIAVQVKHPEITLDFVQGTQYKVRQGMKIAMAVLALAGIAGMYLRQVRQTGILGLVGYLLFSLGYLAMVCVEVIAMTVIPAIAQSSPEYVNGVVAVAFVPDSRRLVSASWEVNRTSRSATYARPRSAGFVRLVADAERRVLVGAVAVGPEAGEWLRQGTPRIRAGVPVDVLRTTRGLLWLQAHAVPGNPPRERDRRMSRGPPPAQRRPGTRERLEPDHERRRQNERNERQLGRSLGQLVEQP